MSSRPLLRLDRGPGQPRPTAHRQDLPPWDRCFDVVFHRLSRDQRSNSHIVEEKRFSKALEHFFKNVGSRREKPSLGFAGFPDNVRLRICNHLLRLTLPGNNRPLRLNKASFNRDSWPHEYFQSPAEIFSLLRPYLDVSFSFRADVLVSFLGHLPLHVVFSPYVGPRLSPLATTWLSCYGVYARDLVVEVDLSRLGCGPAAHAPGLFPNVEHIEALLCDFVESQMRRDAELPLGSLVLLCRRFFGQRGNTPAAVAAVDESVGAGPASSGTGSYSRLSQRSEPAAAAAGFGMRTPSPGLERAQSSSPVRQWLLGRDQGFTVVGTSSSSSSDYDDYGDYDEDDEEDEQDYRDNKNYIFTNHDFSIQEEDYPSASASPSPTLFTYSYPFPPPPHSLTNPLSSAYSLVHRADFCPDAYLTVCDPLLRLRGRVDSLRMCGFAEAYTSRFIEAMFPVAADQEEDMARHAYRVTPSPAWPRLGGQSAYVDFGDGVATLDEHDALPLSAPGEEDEHERLDLQAYEGCVQLPPPDLDENGTPSVPAVVTALQKLRGTSKPEMDDVPMSVDLVVEELTDQVEEGCNLERKKSVRLFELYGKGKGKARRAFSRDVASTL